MLVLALGAGSAASLAEAVPSSLVAVVVGLAVAPVLAGAVRASLAPPLRLGGATALLVAALPLTVAGTAAAVWALPAGIAVSLLLERPALAAAVAR
jgi:benzoate membrane transport protein